MANIGISRASYFAENAVSKLQVSKSNSMQRLASAQANVSGGDKSSFAAMKGTLTLDLSANKAAMKSMSVTQGYLATAIEVLDDASLVLAKLQELAVLGANGTNTTEDNAAIDAEAETLALRFHNIVQNAQYKGASIFQDSDAFSKVSAGSNSALSFGISQIAYDELYDHTNPAVDKTEPEKTYEIIAPLSTTEKNAILQHTDGLDASQLVVGAQFTTIAAGPPPPAPNDDVLLIARNDQPQTITNVKSRLEAAGHTVTVRQQHLDIQDADAPADAASFDQIWDLRYDSTLSQASKDIYDAYVENGGFLFLSSEHSPFSVNNSHKEQLIQQMGGGATSISATDANDTSIDGQNNAFLPDNLTFDSSGVGAIVNDKGTPLYTDSDGDVLAMMWAGRAGSLGDGYTGTIMTIPDIEWYSRSYYDADSQAILDALITGVARATVDGTISKFGNGLDGDGIIEAVPGKIMEAPTDKLANPMSSGSAPTQGQADNDGDASTAITAINTSKIELIQQRINVARTLAGSQYAALSNAIDFATDLSSQFGLGINTISDVNFSMESAHLAKDRMQQDAAAAILAQANKAQEGLMLLV